MRDSVDTAGGPVHGSSSRQWDTAIASIAKRGRCKQGPCTLCRLFTDPRLECRGDDEGQRL